ncbi:MAG: TenA family protein [Acetobacteraceae bacterium]
MTSFSEAAWQRIARLRKAIHALPFNVELSHGSLGQERFRGYIIQDALYLDQYARVLAIAAARSRELGALHAFATSALGVATVERALHERYFAEFGITAGQVAETEPSPDCLNYTSFLTSVAYHEPWEILVAALLPCFWLYWDVSCAIARVSDRANPYRAWIDTYSDEGFGRSVKTVIAITDQAAANSSLQGRMTTAFIRSSQYEWLFWDGAYQRRGWPVAL